MTRARGRSLLVFVVLLVLAGVGYVFGTDADPGRAAPPSTGSSSAVAPPTSASERDPGSGLSWVPLGSLPREAQQTVALIERGGPYPYAKDGATFGNRERILPRQGSGYYREYTVITPGEGDRGARRIVTGDEDRQLFYTADHYDSFVRVRR